MIVLRRKKTPLPAIFYWRRISSFSTFILYLVSSFSIFYHEARERSESSFLWFSKGNQPLHNRSYENSFAKAIWWWMFYRTLWKITCTNMRKNMYVVTPRCAAAAAVVSAVVLRRPTKEYTHPYSMMHRRLPTAGIQVAPHYHQLLVKIYQDKTRTKDHYWQVVISPR